MLAQPRCNGRRSPQPRATRSARACSGVRLPKRTKTARHQSSTTSLVKITIGGNDSGFSNEMLNCALYYCTCGSAISEVNEFIKPTTSWVPRSKRRESHPREGDARPGDRARLPEALHQRRRDVQRQLPDVGQRDEHERIGRELDAVIKACAEALKFTFVIPTSAFESHEVCRLGRVAERTVQPPVRKLPPERERPGRLHQTGRGVQRGRLVRAGPRDRARMNAERG